MASPTGAADRTRLRPRDLDWGLDIDSYFLHDVPPPSAVKKRTGALRDLLLGASMGGMLGYGICRLARHLAGLIAIGAPATSDGAFSPARAALFGPRADGPAAGRGGRAPRASRVAPAKTPRRSSAACAFLARAANLLAAPDSQYKPVNSTTFPSTRSCAPWRAPPPRAT